MSVHFPVRSDGPGRDVKIPPRRKPSHVLEIGTVGCFLIGSEFAWSVGANVAHCITAGALLAALFCMAMVAIYMPGN